AWLERLVLIPAAGLLLYTGPYQDILGLILFASAGFTFLRCAPERDNAGWVLKRATDSHFLKHCYPLDPNRVRRRGRLLLDDEGKGRGTRL
ncbi:MAG TPA: hypothetical protein VFL82_13680, partial [Thermomicrobiales bacterium]|nr:hypothetical protein [Thermomicrobiales bacterium]